MKLLVCISLLIGLLAVGGNTLAATQGEQLVAANKCGLCHGAKTAPKELQFAAFAAKYKGQADATATLVNLLKTGGANDHPKVKASDADLAAIAAVVLSSK